MKGPTQEGFEAWKAVHVKEWAGESASEPRMAWVYLCYLFDTKDALCDRCCADNRCSRNAVESCRSRKKPEVREAIERINTLVEEFVANQNRFPNPNHQNDRIKIVLEDLL